MKLEEWLQKPGNSQTKLAEKMSAIGPPITQGAISQWEEVPPKRVLQVEQATEREVPRYDSRPDLYPRDDAA